MTDKRLLMLGMRLICERLPDEINEVFEDGDEKYHVDVKINKPREIWFDELTHTVLGFEYDVTVRSVV